jgi:ABC-type transport system involved in cytochrome bd biosynthesis fused ATPase/permease subunit
MDNFCYVKPGLKVEISGPTGCGKQFVVSLLQEAFRKHNVKFDYKIGEFTETGITETIEVLEVPKQ